MTADLQQVTVTPRLQRSFCGDSAGRIAMLARAHMCIIRKVNMICSAVDTKLGRLVALKFLPPYAMDSDEDRVRFINEAQAAYPCV